MGRVSWFRAAVACTLMLCAMIVVNRFEAQSFSLDYPVALKASRLVEPPWQPGRQIPMDESIVEALKLDDYLYRQFINGKEDVDLYIGFYHSGEKIGAAHDPLVCFQGQGWAISDRTSGIIDIPGRPDARINYSALVAAHGESREYVFYWFQSFNSTESNTHQQKLRMFFNKLAGKGTSNAFVRITTPIEDQPVEAAFERSVDFAAAFYPAFVSYVTQVE